MTVDDHTTLRALAAPTTPLPAVVQHAINRVLEASAPVPGHEEMTVLVARLLGGLAEVIEVMHTMRVEEVLAAPTDREALVRALTTVPPRLPSAEELEVQQLLDQARLRGVMSRERLLQQEGGVVSAGQATSLLGASRQTVNTRRNNGTLIGLSVGKRGYVYPVWQFASPGTIIGLPDVLRALHGRDPWTQVAFLLNENCHLSGRRPLDALRVGEVGPAVAAACVYGEQGGG